MLRSASEIMTSNDDCCAIFTYSQYSSLADTFTALAIAVGTVDMLAIMVDIVGLTMLVFTLELFTALFTAELV